MNTQPGIIWTSHTTFVDTDTGEVIKKEDALNIRKYIKIKTTKYVKVNKQQSKGHIEFTSEFRKQPQAELPFN